MAESLQQLAYSILSYFKHIYSNVRRFLDIIVDMGKYLFYYFEFQFKAMLMSLLLFQYRFSYQIFTLYLLLCGKYITKYFDLQMNTENKFIIYPSSKPKLIFISSICFHFD